MIRHLLLLFVASTAAASCLAQEKEPINSDRPDFTDSPNVLCKGVLQFEGGATYQWSKGAYSFSLPEGLFRYGLPGWELRVGLPDLNWVRADGAMTTGTGDFYLGGKMKLGKFAGGEIGVIPGVFLPSRDANFSSGSLDADLELVWEKELGRKWSVGSMLHGIYTTDADGRFWMGQATVSFVRELCERSDMFFEYAMNFSQRGCTRPCPSLWLRNPDGCRHPVRHPRGILAGFH